MAEPTKTTNAGQPDVLMVDDDLDLLEEYRELLECYGVSVAICDSPVKAIDLVRNSASINVVMSDLRMSEMDGATMFDQIRNAVGPDRKIAFALVTGAHDVEPALCGPDVQVLYKPVDPEDLLTIIEQA